MTQADFTFLGLENPLLDMSANVPMDFLKKYELKENDAILAGESHKSLYKEMVEKFEVEYVAGGATQNSMRGAQWMLPANSTVFMGCVGADAEADKLRAAAGKDGLLAEYLVDPVLATGLCAVLITGHNRSMVTDLMAANAYKIDHLKTSWTRVEQAQYYYSSGYFLTVSPESAMLIAEHAAATGKVFTTNIAAPFIAQFFKDPLAALLPYCDIVFGNETEAEAYGTAAGMTDVSPTAVALAIAALPKVGTARGRLVVITQGTGPTIVATTTGAPTSHPIIPVEKGAIVDTTGAGDGFVGGFMAAFIKGHPVPKCVEAGHYVASNVIQRSGPTYPTTPPTFVI